MLLDVFNKIIRAELNSQNVAFEHTYWAVWGFIRFLRDIRCTPLKSAWRERVGATGIPNMENEAEDASIHLATKDRRDCMSTGISALSPAVATKWQEDLSRRRWEFSVPHWNPLLITAFNPVLSVSRSNVFVIVTDPPVELWPEDGAAGLVPSSTIRLVCRARKLLQATKMRSRKWRPDLCRRGGGKGSSLNCFGI